MTCAANASLISTRSISSMVMPALARACREASTGPSPMISGESAVTPVATILASGVSPSSAALRSLITITAAAPSFSGQQLPAVTVPSGRNTGFSADTFSSVVPARGPSSAETTVPSGSGGGVLSRRQQPSPSAPRARPDRVESHPGGLQRGRAVPGHRGAGQRVVAEHDGDDAGHVEALLAAGQPAAQHQVADVSRVKLRHLGQCCGDHLDSQVIGPDADE